ncbi:MAG: hypothetical protein LBQ36_03710 [Synergistaceae bacterium]|nr:hypothetical protein [Synergistaceae bacterium]
MEPPELAAETRPLVETLPLAGSWAQAEGSNKPVEPPELAAATRQQEAPVEPQAMKAWSKRRPRASMKATAPMLPAEATKPPGSEAIAAPEAMAAGRRRRAKLLFLASAEPKARAAAMRPQAEWAAATKLPGPGAVAERAATAAWEAVR